MGAEHSTIKDRRNEDTPHICRQICCDSARGEVIELLEGPGGSHPQDQVCPLTTRHSGTRAIGWPEHFELELDELRLLGVLGFELRGFGPRPKHQFRSGAVYIGQWSSNEREGFGRQTWPDGAQYEGCWSSSAASGPGRFKFPDGSVYLGQWRSNRFHGLGAYYLADGSTYRGSWVHGLCEGMGVEIRAQEGTDLPAATYWGRFSRGVKEGAGVCRWDEGSKYAGQWRSGQISGSGKLVSEGGKRSYMGQWIRAMKHGRGVYKWPDGREHRGQYRLDAASGFGSLHWPDGKRYEGFWRNACLTGRGVFTDANGLQQPLPFGLLMKTPAEASKQESPQDQPTAESENEKEDEDEPEANDEGIDNKDVECNTDKTNNMNEVVTDVGANAKDMKTCDSSLQLGEAPFGKGLDQFWHLQVADFDMDQDAPSTSPGSSSPGEHHLPATPMSMDISELSVPREGVSIDSWPGRQATSSPNSPSSIGWAPKSLRAATQVSQNLLRRTAARAGA
eukprot:TRINITY_DN73517_c0_g1_i1.p1 TRINITY_DN73517_c0_g1~~TRINITY_DN73517_c0_g1_i1.p1  ORF type:complete len:506 (-),score=71.91 TRINITY_DN73517_c0_g1_i1:315-1832(-)